MPHPSHMQDPGKWIYSLIKELYPICRSITGDGVRRTLNTLGKHIQLNLLEVATGTPVFDWTVPKEWNIRDAWIKNSIGQRLIDFNNSNLHVVNYSIPVHASMSLKELRPHLHTLPDYPDRIPYRTSYYNETWGFCLTHDQLTNLPEDEYEVCIEATLEDGHLTYGEYLIKGESEEEILISSHVCHPSLCNDNLSGVCVATALAKWMAAEPRRYSYRFLFAPGTIGAITWLARNQESVKSLRHGLILTSVGDDGCLTYKRSRRGNAEVDRAVEHILGYYTTDYKVEDFSPYGYDERQFGSPGFNLPVGRLSRSPFGTYSEYHTSADNLEFVHPQSLGDTFDKLVKVVQILENNRRYINLFPYCEPQLGRRGLYQAIGDEELAMLWVLNMSDGHSDLLAIAERASIPFAKIQLAAVKLEAHKLIKRFDDQAVS